MQELDDLYQQLILEHSKSPLNVGTIGEGAFRAHLANPVCGDEIDLYVMIKDGLVTEAKFSGHGCSISQAAASMMTEKLQGMTVKQVKVLLSSFEGLLKGQVSPSASGEQEELGDLIALGGVKKFPVRIPCAMLAFEALAKIVKSENA